MALYEWTSLIPSFSVYGFLSFLESHDFSLVGVFLFPFCSFCSCSFCCCLLYTAHILWHPRLMKLFTYQKKKDLWASRPCMNGPHQFPSFSMDAFLGFLESMTSHWLLFFFSLFVLFFFFFLSCLLYTARNLGHHLFWLVMKLFTSKKKEEDLWASRQCYPNNETGTTGGH